MPLNSDYQTIVITDTGLEVLSAIITNFQNTELDLLARPEKAVAETITKEWTFPSIERNNAFFYARGSSSGVISDQGAITYMTFTSERSDSIYTVGSNYVECDEAGWYRIRMDGTADNTNGTYNDRFTVRWAIYKSTGGSYFEITGARAFSYHRNLDDGEDTATVEILEQLNANDRIAFICTVHTNHDAANDIIRVANGCRFMIEKV